MAHGVAPTGTAANAKPSKDERCDSWCHENEQPWTTRCEFVYCRGCTPCIAMHNTTYGCPMDSLAAPTVTMCCRNDGFGAQYLALISVYAFSVLARRTFCGAPFHVVPHFAAQGAAMALDASKLFAFVGGDNFGPHASQSTPAKRNAANEISTVAPSLQPYHAVVDRVRSWYEAATPKPVLRHFIGSSYNVALHIRLGDIAPSGAVPKPELIASESEIVACVRRVMHRAPQHAVLHVFSQGSLSEFAFLRRWKAIIHLDSASNASARAQTEEVMSIFHHMVQADALIIARSSLSITAGYLSRGHVYVPPHKSDRDRSSRGGETPARRNYGEKVQTVGTSIIPHLRGCG